MHRRERGTPLLADEDSSIVALATDEPLPGSRLPQFGLDDVPAIAAFVLARLGIGGPA